MCPKSLNNNPGGHSYDRNTYGPGNEGIMRYQGNRHYDQKHGVITTRNTESRDTKARANEQPKLSRKTPFRPHKSNRKHRRRKA